MRQYELTYLVSDKVAESDLNKITGKVGGFVVDAKGQVFKEEIWKRRKLAYPINKQEFATYVTLNFEVSADKVREIEHDLKITPQIIRHLLILREMGEEKLTLTSDEIVGTEDIEEVIGGEKSFEAVEGETEESRDLMAKREGQDSGLRTQDSENTEEPEIEEMAETPEAPRPEADQPMADVEEVKVKKSRAKKVETTEENQELRIKNQESAPETKTFEATAEEKVSESADQLISKSATEEEKKPIRKRIKPVVSSEAERLAKLDEELDNLLKDDL